MMCGAMLQAKANGMIIIVDGFIVTSALLAAYKMDKTILDNCIFCHCSGEKGHKAMLDYLGGVALVDLGMRLGEGTRSCCYLPIDKIGRVISERKWPVLKVPEFQIKINLKMY